MFSIWWQALQHQRFTSHCALGPQVQWQWVHEDDSILQVKWKVKTKRLIHFVCKCVHLYLLSLKTLTKTRQFKKWQTHLLSHTFHSSVLKVHRANHLWTLITATLRVTWQFLLSLQYLSAFCDDLPRLPLSVTPSVGFIYLILYKQTGQTLQQIQCDFSKQKTEFGNSSLAFLSSLVCVWCPKWEVWCALFHPHIYIQLFHLVRANSD